MSTGMYVNGRLGRALLRPLVGGALAALLLSGATAHGNDSKLSKADAGIVVSLEADGDGYSTSHRGIVTEREAGSGMATGRRLAAAGTPGLSAWRFEQDGSRGARFTVETTGLTWRASAALERLATQKEGYLFFVEQRGLVIAVTDTSASISIGEPGVQLVDEQNLRFTLRGDSVKVQLKPGHASFSIGEPGVQ